MSQFVKNQAELLALRRGDRISGFTDAELAAAEWSRDLVESRQNIQRPTNAEARTFTSSAETRPKLAQQQDERHSLKVGQEERAREQSKENMQKEKKEKKERKPKDKKEKKEPKQTQRRLEKGARKLAKEMRREEKARRKHPRHDPLSETQAEILAGIKESNGSACDIIDDLIETARQQIDSALNISIGPDISTNHVASAGEDAAQPAITPRDPLNPLERAHDLEAYRKLQGQSSGGEVDDGLDWNHLPYLYRSPSPCRLRTHGPMWPTRKGAWKSRAGGVYLPATQGGANEAPKGVVTSRVTSRGFDSPIRSPSPARYMYPDEFKEKYVIPQRRRSPSYKPEPKRSDSQSSADMRSLHTSRSRSRRAKKKKRKPTKTSTSSNAQA